MCGVRPHEIAHELRGAKIPPASSILRAPRLCATVRTKSRSDPLRVSNSIIALLASLSAAAGLTIACVDVAYPNKAFRCNPAGPSPTCPDGFFCCSDDPTVDPYTDAERTDPGALPNFAEHKIDGKEWAIPLFAGENNKLSHSGMCVKLNTDPQTIKGTAAAGCPIPCNPKWSNEAIAKVCGDEKSACCQTVQLDAKDCVPEGPNKCTRAVVGSDVFSDPQLSNWSGSAHRTHQDPGGLECAKRYEKGKDKWSNCVRKLTVADQRGFCIAPIESNGKKERAQCPLKKASYQDACEILNSSIQGCPQSGGT